MSFAGAASALIVDVARIETAEVDVGLIALERPLAYRGQFLAAVLNAAVRAVQPELELELEIAHRLAAPDEKTVRLQGLLRRGFADDFAVLDSPDVRVAVPAIQALAVEDRNKTLGVIGLRRREYAAGLAGRRRLLTGDRDRKCQGDRRRKGQQPRAIGDNGRHDELADRADLDHGGHCSAGVPRAGQATRCGTGAGTTERARRAPRRPPVGHAGLRRQGIREDPADRSDCRRGRQLQECVRHDLALFAEPRVAAHRRVCPPARRDQQLHRAAGGARDVSQGAAAVRVHDGLRRQVAHGREQRRAAARLRLLRHPQGAGQVLRHRVQLQRRKARGQARLLHDRGHRHRARLAAARSPAEAMDDDPRPQGDAQLLHAGKDVRARVRHRAGQLPRIRVLAGGQTGLGEGSPRHVARHLRPALRMAKEIPRRSAGSGEGLRQHGARLPGDAAERRRQRRPAARVARTVETAGQHHRRLRRRQRAARGRARHGRQADDARAEHPDSAGRALPGADAHRPKRSTSRC